MSLKIWRGPTNALVMAPESPTLVYTDRVRATDIYMGVQSVCAANMLSRGTFGSGIRSGWVLNQCTLTTSRGNVGRLVYEWEAGGSSATQPLPTGDFSLDPQELYPKVERNAYFQGTSGVYGGPTTPITLDTIALVYSALYNETETGRASAGAALAAITDADQLALATKLLLKLRNGEETYYVAGWRYWYETYSYSLPTVSRGAVVVTPGGPLAGHLPSGVSWLRLADNLTPAGVNGSMYKLRVNCLGGPGGHWDTDLYNGV